MRSDAGTYLLVRGDAPQDLKVYAARRGNWEVMLRRLSTNRSAINQPALGLAPGTTVHATSGQILPLWQAADLYAQEKQPVVIVAAERYGMGSSRDWAAKGVALLGVRAVIAKSFERIHRSNLIGMGILPLQLPKETTLPALEPSSTITVDLSVAAIQPRTGVRIEIATLDQSVLTVWTVAAIETAAEAATLMAGGFLPKLIADAVHESELAAGAAPH